MFGALGVPGSQLLEEEARKCMCWGLGSELVRGERFLKGFWHLGNLGDTSRPMLKDWKGVWGLGFDYDASR